MRFDSIALIVGTILIIGIIVHEVVKANIYINTLSSTSINTFNNGG
jgi:hypothetical protein